MFPGGSAREKSELKPQMNGSTELAEVTDRHRSERVAAEAVFPEKSVFVCANLWRPGNQ
jgi:hypothetical protein